MTMKRSGEKTRIYLITGGGIIVYYVLYQHIMIILFVTHVNEIEKLKKNKEEKLRNKF